MGRVFKPTYTVPGPKGERITKTAKAFYVEYTDALGGTVRRKAGVTEAQARDALRKAEAVVLDEKNGMPTYRVADLTCSELSKAYLEAQRAQVCPHHLEGLVHRLETVLNATRAVRVKDLTPEKAEACLAGLEAQGLSARTVNTYLQAVKGCMAWAVDSRKIPFSPLDCVKNRPVHEPRRARRPLSEDECARLLAATLEGPARRATRAYKDGRLPLAVQADLAEQGRRNALIVTLLVQTGLRVGELTRLTWADVDLKAGSLRCRAEWTKNRKADVLPLHPSLVEALQGWKARYPSAEAAPVVKIPAGFARKFDNDLVAAGIARLVPVDRERRPVPLDAGGRPVTPPAKWVVDKRDSAGRNVDLHSLRHTFAQRLNAAGVDPKTMQALMRHSTPVLTLGVYIHRDRQRMADAVASLSELAPAPRHETEAAAKTGTDDAPVYAEEKPTSEVLPPSIRQAKTVASCNGSDSNELVNVVRQPSKLITRVRFPPPAPYPNRTIKRIPASA